MLVMAMLRRLGCRADLVATAPKPWTGGRGVPYAAALTDCQMPELEG